MAQNLQKEGKGPNHKGRFITIGITAVLLWGAAPIILNSITHSLAEKGQIGDMFGTVNALFSGLALGGVIYAVYLQIEQLQDQKKDAEDSRNHDREIRDISVFNQLHANLSQGLDSIVCQKITEYMGSTGGVAASTVKWHGATAIEQYRILSQHKTTAQDRDKKVEFTFSFESVPQYLNSYILILDWVGNIKDDEVRKICSDLVKKGQEIVIKKIFDNRSTIFSTIDQTLLDSVKNLSNF